MLDKYRLEKVCAIHAGQTFSFIGPILYFMHTQVIVCCITIWFNSFNCALAQDHTNGLMAPC